MANRATNRTKIVNALIDKFLEINGSSEFNSDLNGNVFNKLKFWDEINDFPSVFVNAGPETREYLPGNFKWGYLTITVRIYVKAEEPEIELESIMADIEYIVDTNGNLQYDRLPNRYTEDIKILTINTDEGLLAPVGVGEITLHIRYDIDSSN